MHQLVYTKPNQHQQIKCIIAKYESVQNISSSRYVIINITILSVGFVLLSPIHSIFTSHIKEIGTTRRAIQKFFLLRFYTTTAQILYLVFYYQWQCSDMVARVNELCIGHPLFNMCQKQGTIWCCLKLWKPKTLLTFAMGRKAHAP